MSTNTNPTDATDRHGSGGGAALEIEGSSISLEWGFWDAQLRALDALYSGDYDVVVFRGGYGSGKSVLGSRWITEVALATPGSDNLVMAQDTAKGGPTTYKVFFEQLPGANTVPDEGGDPANSPLVEDYHRRDRRLTLFNGAIIRLGSADRWNRYAGGEFNAIWCDEVAHYETTDLYKLNRMLISRQRTEQGPNVTLWTSTGNGYNQFYDFVEVQETPDGDPLPTRITNVVADSRNNPFLNEVEKLKRQFEDTAVEAQGLAGGFAADEGRVYQRFSRPRHVRPRSEIAPDLVEGWRIYGYDAGWDDPRVVVEIGKTHHDQLAVLDHYYEEGAPIEAVVDPDGVRPDEPWLAGKPDGTVYSEHEPEHIRKFRRAGWEAVKAEKSLDEGIPHVRGRLDVDQEDRPGLLVADECSALIKEFLSYKEDHVGTTKAEDHALDALRYALFTHSQRAGGSEDTEGSGISYI